MPQILLEESPFTCSFVSDNSIGGMASADTSRLHAARCGEVRRTETHAMHARTCSSDSIDVLDAFGGFQNSVDENGLLKPMLGLELSEQLVHIVDVPVAFNLGHHQHVELVTNSAHNSGHIIEEPRAIQCVYASPKPGIGEVILSGNANESCAGRIFSFGRNCIFQITKQHIDVGDDGCGLCTDLFVVRRQKMHGALERQRQLPQGLRRTNR